MKPRATYWEINAKDGPALSAFYKAIFDWDLTENEKSGVTHVDSGDGTDGGIPGGIFTGKGALPTHRCLYVKVDDVDAVCDLVRAQGRPIAQEPFDFQGRVRLGLFEDPEGHMIGLSGPCRDTPS